MNTSVTHDDRGRGWGGGEEGGRGGGGGRGVEGVRKEGGMGVEGGGRGLGADVDARIAGGNRRALVGVQYRSVFQPGG